MKKLSLILVLLAFAGAFAHDVPKKENFKKVHRTNQECSQYEATEDGALYKNGKEVTDISALSIAMGCGDRIKGAEKAKQKRNKHNKK